MVCSSALGLLGMKPSLVNADEHLGRSSPWWWLCDVPLKCAAGWVAKMKHFFFFCRESRGNYTPPFYDACLLPRIPKDLTAFQGEQVPWEVLTLGLWLVRADGSVAVSAAPGDLGLLAWWAGLGRDVCSAILFLSVFHALKSREAEGFSSKPEEGSRWQLSFSRIPVLEAQTGSSPSLSRPAQKEFSAQARLALVHELPPTNTPCIQASHSCPGPTRVLILVLLHTALLKSVFLHKMMGKAMISSLL